MDGIARPSGAGCTIELGGRTLILEPIRLRDFGVIENHLLARRANPLKMVAEVLPLLPKEEGERLLQQAYKDARAGNKIPAEEVAAWLDTLEGLTFSLWLSLEKRYAGEFTLEAISDLLEEMTLEALEDLKHRRAMADGVDTLGNSTGQATCPEPNPPEAAKDAPAGGDGSTT